MPTAYSLVYQSTATSLLTEAALLDILISARGFNSQHRITGLLLASSGRLMQFLEGPEAPIRALYARIERDPRHTAVALLADGSATAREFPDWAMGFAATQFDLTYPGALNVVRPDFLLGREHNFSAPTAARIATFLAG